jgi:hypothetical protein
MKKGDTVEITQEHKEKMEDIIVGMRTDGRYCSKGFHCYNSSLEDLCPVKGIGVFGTIECASKDAQCCEFSSTAVGNRYCQCPLRRYIAANFHR